MYVWERCISCNHTHPLVYPPTLYCHHHCAWWWGCADDSDLNNLSPTIHEEPYWICRESPDKRHFIGQCLTIVNLPFLVWSYAWAMTGELWSQTHITAAFRYAILCTLSSCITWKLLGAYEHSTYQTTTLLSETFLYWFRDVRELRFGRTMVPNKHHGLFLIQNFVHTSSVNRKPQGGFNTTTSKQFPTPVDSSKPVTLTYNLWSCTCITVLLLYMQANMRTVLRVPMMVLHTKRLIYYQWCIFLKVLMN